MKKRLSTQTMMNSDPDLVLSDDMKKLIIDYMTAANENNHAKADSLLDKIKQENRKNGNQD